MRQALRNHHGGKQAQRVAMVEALEARCLLSGSAILRAMAHKAADTAVPPFQGTASPGATTSPAPVLTTLTPTLQWTADNETAAVTGIQITLSDRTRSKTTTYRVDAAATSFTVPAGVLINGDTYVWNLKYVEGSRTGKPGTYLLFQAPPVAAPVVISPGDPTAPGPVLTTTTPTFEWNAVSVPEMTGYQLNLFDITSGKGTTYKVGKTATHFTLPSGVLSGGDAYVWNVRVLQGTRSGAPSTYLYFQAPTTTVNLPVPVTTTPGETTPPGPVLTTLTPTLEWTATPVAGMTGYQLTLYDVTQGKTSGFNVGTSATSFTLPAGALTAGDAYVWNVRAVAGTHGGTVSNYRYFQAPPATVQAPVAVSPGEATAPGPVQTTLTPTLHWNGVTGVTGMTGYQVTLYDVTAGKGTTYKVGASVTSLTLPTGALTAGDDYVWNVRVAIGDTTGPVSNYLYFQAAPLATLPAPVIVSPGDATSPGPRLTTSTPTFQWTAVTGVSGLTGYQLTLYDLTKSKSTTYTVGAGDTSYTLPAGVLVNGDAYVWNLRVLAGTRIGPVSNYLYFLAPAATTVPAPVITSPGTSSSPGTTVTTTTPTLQWNAVTGVAGMTGYQINLYDVTQGKATSYRVSSEATSYTFAGALTSGDTYVWNLRLVLGSTTGPESNYLYFTVHA